MRRLLLTAIAIFAGYSTAMASSFSGPQTGFSVGSFDRHVAAHHTRACGLPIGGVTWVPLQATQRFQHCTIRARYRAMTATPRSTVAATPQLRATETAFPSPTPTALPSNPTPRPTQTPLPVPTETALPATDPVQRALQIINGHRAEYGVRPLTLNATQSVNSMEHAAAMAATGQIWHVNALYPQYSFPNNIVVPVFTAGENVGAGGSVDLLEALMWAEPHDATTCATQNDHACNEINPRFTGVGIGLYQSGGYVWYVADFVG